MRLTRLIRLSPRLLPVFPKRKRKANPTRRAARTAVLSGAPGLVLGMAGLAVVVETIRPEWRDPEYGHRLKRFQLLIAHNSRTGNSRPIVVAIGSSRVAHGFSPPHLGLDDTPTSPLVLN